MPPQRLRIVLLGSGGREHALAWKLSQSSMVEMIMICPGNAATGDLPKTTNRFCESISEALALSKSHDINLALFTRESDLATGAVDLFSREGIKCIGPSQSAALLESSKVFAKQFMKKYEVPTASYREFSNNQSALSYIEDQLSRGKERLVLKHSGIVAKQSIFIIETLEEAATTLTCHFGKEVGKLSNHSFSHILVEEFLGGPEFTVMALTDGRNFSMFPPYLDFKRREEYNKGPITGGMGCICPTTRCTDLMLQHLEQNFMARTISGLEKEGLSFAGFIAIGIILTEERPMAIEYDLRLGDPETQALLPLMNPEVDLAAALTRCLHAELSSSSLWFQRGLVAVVVMAVTEDYPFCSNRRAFHVELDIPTQKDMIVFHNNTFFADQQGMHVLQAQSGRVVGVCGIGRTLEHAAERAYSGMIAIRFEGITYRHDIACSS